MNDFNAKNITGLVLNEKQIIFIKTKKLLFSNQNNEFTLTGEFIPKDEVSSENEIQTKSLSKSEKRWIEFFKKDAENNQNTGK